MPINRMIRASDANAWTLCRRRVWYDHNPPLEGTLEADAFDQLIQEAGEAHEQAVLEALSAEAEVIEALSAEHTRALMAERAPVIFQPVAVDDEINLLGKPDFLIYRGQDQYQVADAKLAGSLKGRNDLKIQLALYRRLFATRLPALAYLGSGNQEEVSTESDDLADRFLDSMQSLLAELEPPPAHYGYSKCSACPWHDVCLPDFEAREALSLLYGLDARSIPALEKQGITTIRDLADADPGRMSDAPWLKGEAKKKRMVLQAQVYLSGHFKVLEKPDLRSGTWVHFDLESNPLAESGPAVYLWGWLLPPYDADDFEYTWSDGGEDNDYRAWVNFLARMTELRRQHPDLVLAHFANFEVVQIKTYAARYRMEEDPCVQWLLGDDSPLFDMRDVVRRCLVLPLRSYGLKPLCKSRQLVNFQWQTEESGSQWSVVRYLDYLNAGNGKTRDTIKQEILGYNRDDVRATRALELWLRGLAKRGGPAE